jgi:dTMP kinase
MTNIVKDIMKGAFIAFEGLDGSGLTTQSVMLRDHFINTGREVVLTKEQTDGLIGGLIKSCLKGEWRASPLALQLLFAADRAQHLRNEIEPALKMGKTVISDRYILSSLAYGAVDLDLNFLKQINSGFRKPDLTIIIDTKPETCLERIKSSRFGVELFEEKKKLEEIRRNYLSLKSHFPNTAVIDGNRKIEEVFEDVKKACEQQKRL